MDRLIIDQSVMVHPALSWLAIHTTGSFRTRTRPQISTWPSHFCDELIKKLETTKETSAVIAKLRRDPFSSKGDFE
jgi:hypothetical protein